MSISCQQRKNKESDGGGRSPPTIYSGFGEVTDDDMVLPPSAVLNAHETAVRVWLSNLSKKALKTQVNVAANHAHYKRFVNSTSRCHKFGSPEHAVDDLCEFDVWLKKLALGEKKFVSPPPSKPAFSPLPATPASVAAPKISMPSKADPEKIVHLTPEQQTPYKEWWGKFQSGTPGPTPDSKRLPPPKETGLVFSNYRFMTIHLFLVGGKWFFFGAGPTEMTPPSVTLGT